MWTVAAMSLRKFWGFLYTSFKPEMMLQIITVSKNTFGEVTVLIQESPKAKVCDKTTSKQQLKPSLPNFHQEFSISCLLLHLEIFLL